MIIKRIATFIATYVEFEGINYIRYYDPDNEMAHWEQILKNNLVEAIKDDSKLLQLEQTYQEHTK